MRHFWENPFIGHECTLHHIETAPINTNIYETYGQCNEDLIIEAVLRAQCLRRGRGMETVRYIEMGANHPVQTSATYLLYRVHGACGVLVEPIPALADTLRAIRPRDTVVNCLVTTSDAPTLDLHVHEKHELSSLSVDHIAPFVQFGGKEGIQGTITCDNLHINNFMRQYGSGAVDFLSVDLEGLDIEVLRAMDRAFHPTMIQCEHEGRIEAFSQLLDGHGYGLLALTDVNAIFLSRNVF